jgi:hypothetical protein
LAYKDEFEVARLHLATEAKARESFEGDFKMTFHLAPPLLPGGWGGAAEEAGVRRLDDAGLPATGADEGVARDGR